MRKMIRNLLSALVKLKSNSLLLIIFIFTLGASYIKNYEEIKLNETKFYSKENTALEFAEDSIYCVLLKNNKSCLNCFTILSNYLKILKSKEPIKLIAITHSDSAPLARRRNIYESKITFPDFNEHGVTYSQKWGESSPTPELLIIKRNKAYLFNYSEIFADGFDFISISAQEHISEIIKSK